MTKRMKQRKFRTAAHRQKERSAAKEVAMVPIHEQTQIPDSMTLEHRAVCQPNVDEPMMLRGRDDERRVYATVERWQREFPVN